MYETILVALDGSPDSLEAGRLAVLAARNCGARLLATHVYDLAIHEQRFEQMEPGLPADYQETERLEELREGHDQLMTEGFLALSKGYMQAYIEQARAAGADVQELVLEGRNYVRLLEATAEHGVSLIALGAQGLGAVDDGAVGSVALRVLRAAQTDVLLARQTASAPQPDDGCVLAGIDGSTWALGAMRRAHEWATWGDADLELVAAFDPGLHQQVFRTMARAMPVEVQEKVGLETQERLHEALIDDGLATLYRQFLDQAAEAVEGPRPQTHLVAAKAYQGLLQQSADLGASLLSVGRFGHHREEISTLGSNAERVAALAPCSVLVTCGEAQAQVESAEPDPPLPWDPEAEQHLERVPGFARNMARRAVEEEARAQGETRVTAQRFAATAAKLGMGRPG